MQIKSFLLAPLLATGLVDAASTNSKPFEVMSLRSASPIHFQTLQAARNNFYLKLPDQKATCTSKSDNSATLQIVNGELVLYNSKAKTHQRAFTDRSGMGQGVLQYTSSTTLPAKFETKGWAIDKAGNLNFKGAGLLACPGGVSGSWIVWVDTGIASPGGNKKCLGFSGRTTTIAKPNSCTYTDRK